MSVITTCIHLIYRFKLLLYENINELIGQNLTVTLQFHGARDLPPKYATDVYLAYKWVDENQDDYNTEKTQTGVNVIHPEFKYKYEHSLYISNILAERIWESILTINVYGKISKEQRAALENRL